MRFPWEEDESPQREGSKEQGRGRIPQKGTGFQGFIPLGSWDGLSRGVGTWVCLDSPSPGPCSNVGWGQVARLHPASK